MLTSPTSDTKNQRSLVLARVRPEGVSGRSVGAGEYGNFILGVRAKQHLAKLLLPTGGSLVPFPTPRPLPISRYTDGFMTVSTPAFGRIQTDTRTRTELGGCESERPRYEAIHAARREQAAACVVRR